MKEREKSSKTPGILAWAIELENKGEIKNTVIIVFKIVNFQIF